MEVLGTFTRDSKPALPEREPLLKTRSQRGTFRCLFCILIPIICFSSQVYSEERLSREFQLKAAFLTKFLSFIEWPASTDVIATKEICILGKSPFGEVLQKIVDFDPRESKPKIRQSTDSSDLSSCSLLYISGSEKSNLGRILAAIDGKPVVTVSDIDNFAEEGGMIQFTVDGPHVRFLINQKPADVAGLKFSSQLLALSKPRAE